jgi:putative DNA primase/helicase
MPEAGKTTIALSFAATVSSGGQWPDGTRATAGNVLIWSSEDDAADTLIPRLTRMKADLSRIHIVEQTRPPGQKPRPFNPATDLAALIDKAEAIGGVALFVIDSVVSAVPPSRNSHNNVETRAGLQPVVDFAKATNAMTLGIAHLAKGSTGREPLERIMSSGAFGALPRLVMMAAVNNADAPDEPERIMVRAKSNIGPRGGGFGYHIDAAVLQLGIEATRVVWETAIEGTARDLLANAEGCQGDGESRLDHAKAFLRQMLADGERAQATVLAAALAQGIAEKTLRRAAKDPEFSKRKDGHGGWFWGKVAKNL